MEESFPMAQWCSCVLLETSEDAHQKIIKVWQKSQPNEHERGLP